ncbi:FHA domain-containing protein [Myxococcus sp. CA051A]|uniref:FHA domain-containing protein n=1 Tax=unclassified Myxococcus TaxID=2648731 RepID=UPI00157B5FAA|nr:MULTISPECIES: FHA domain-containing protein [unclassified Myxococcus]NTX13164.1 FHA domain-containing protein [Myxococcus sp. CA056]NTX36385.1 FHA domain-containing protein [Myxococcus sp. CA033]NTX55847.1 FHA domain-containing protein [Myxococcus sp. CA039A]NTX64693.1 FHA domain-containing protein [Myxococcus sp. CA051A]
MPARPPSSPRAGAGRSGGDAGADSPSAKPSARARPPREASPADEDFAAPLSGEEGYPDGPANPELYGDAQPPRSRTDETRVGAVPESREDAVRRDDDDDNSESTRAGPPVQMLVLAGPDRGRKKRFQGVRMVVGRGKDCDFVLDDQSVSRRHLELVYGQTGVAMRDLGSISGTQVNDQRVDECLLKHGDEIAMGKTRLRFVDEAEQIKEMRAQAEAREAEEKREREEAAKEKDEARKAAGAARGSDVDPNDPRLNEMTNANYRVPDGFQDKAQNKGKGAIAIPRPRPPPRSAVTGGGPNSKTKLLIAVGGGVVVLLMLGLLFIPSGPPPPPPVDPNIERSKLLMQKAREAVRADDYATAVRLVEEAEKLRPGVDEEGLGKAASKQLEVVQSFESVRALMVAQQFEEARTKLAATPQGTAKMDDIRRKLETELEEKDAAFRIQQMEDALAARDPEAARPLLDRVPDLNKPAYAQKLQDLEAELAKESADGARRDRANRERAALNAKEERKLFLEEAFTDVERRFNGGDYQRAVLECDRVTEKYKAEKDVKERARQLKTLIPQFQRSLDDAQKKLASNALESASKPLRRAAELYRQIGFQGSLGNTLDEQLASAALAAGQAALKKGDLAAAGLNFREALRLNPGDRRARDGLDDLQKKVEELYMRAYIERDRDPQSAAVKFKIVIETAPEGSDTKRKAEMYLSELQP